MIELFVGVLGVGDGLAVGVAVGAAALCINFTLIVGAEYPKPAALKWSQPLLSRNTDVAT